MGDDTSSGAGRRNMPPADELELVRAEIKRLRAREAELRAEIVGQADGESIGRDWRVEIVEQRRRSLDRAALPPEIARDPRYWKESVTRIVRTVPAGARRPRRARARTAVRNSRLSGRLA